MGRGKRWLENPLGYFSFVGGNLVTWKSIKELWFPQQETCRLFCDNKVAISISENLIQHDRTKHVEDDRHFIKDNPENKIISLPHIKSKDQITNILTKAIRVEAFEGVLCKLRNQDPTTQLEGLCRKVSYVEVKFSIWILSFWIYDLLEKIAEFVI